MSVLLPIQEARLEISLHKSGNLYVAPASKLTDQQREYIRAHKREIISQLVARNKRLSDAELFQLLHSACEGFPVKPEQFWSFLDDQDVEDIRSGLIQSDQLKAFARSVSRYPEYMPICNSQPFPTEKL